MWAHHIRPSHHNNGEVPQQKESRTALQQNINIYRIVSKWQENYSTREQGTNYSFGIRLTLFACVPGSKRGPGNDKECAKKNLF